MWIYWVYEVEFMFYLLTYLDAQQASYIHCYMNLTRIIQNILLWIKDEQLEDVNVKQTCCPIYDSVETKSVCISVSPSIHPRLPKPWTSHSHHTYPPAYWLTSYTSARTHMNAHTWTLTHTTTTTVFACSFPF